MRVLIADDSIVSRHLLDATLRGWGYETVLAGDGAEALALLQRPDAPSLAVLDWMMPRMTGLDVCRQLRQQGREPYTYILLLTSKSLKEDLIAGMEAGADDYVIKPFDQHELKVRLRAGTRIVELQAELLAAREALREQATHDALTRVWNRPSVLEILQREIDRAEREATTVGVLLVDLDHFKTVNDTYGHIAGDAVLMEAARRMQMSIRAYDGLGRYGGEEFLMILPGCDGTCAQLQAERIRAALSERPMRMHNQDLFVTASFGVTTTVLGMRSTPEALIRVADQALYRAKDLGRNCVVYEPFAVPVEVGLESLRRATARLAVQPEND